MLRAIIIDDEQPCIDKLSALLAEHASHFIELVGTASSVDEGLHAIKSLHPNVVFLDVEIQGRTGFDLLRQLREVRFDVIFTTAHNKYALEAIKVSAIDFLLKPVDPDDLNQAIEKLERKAAHDGNGHYDEMSRKLDVLFHWMEKSKTPSKKISLSVGDAIEFIEVNDIIRCQAEGNYTDVFLHSPARKITVTKTLKELETQLAEHNFFRVHHAHLINLAHIKKYSRGTGGFVTMIDNAEEGRIFAKDCRRQSMNTPPLRA